MPHYIWKEFLDRILFVNRLNVSKDPIDLYYICKRVIPLGLSLRKCRWVSINSMNYLSYLPNEYSSSTIDDPNQKYLHLIILFAFIEFP